MVMICPYCDIEISESSVEAEDGCCPECGAIISASGSMGDDEELDEFDDDFGDDDFGDDDDLGFDDDLGYDDLDDDDYGKDDDY